MRKPKPAPYRRAIWSDDNTALRKRGSLLIWLDKEMAWHTPHEGRPGRPPVFCDAAIQFCLSIMVLFKLPLRQKALKVQIPYRRAEAKMRCLRSFGERIAARDPDRQTAERHIRVTLMNRFNTLGTAKIVRVT